MLLQRMYRIHITDISDAYHQEEEVHSRGIYNGKQTARRFILSNQKYFALPAAIFVLIAVPPGVVKKHRQCLFWHD